LAKIGMPSAVKASGTAVKPVPSVAPLAAAIAMSRARLVGVGSCNA
jgi:hypothetical protein